MMQGKMLLLIFAAVVTSAAGQLLLTSGARRITETGRLEFLIAALCDVHVLSGLVAWTVSTVCWLYVLRIAPLSRAYGLTSLTYVLILIASVHFFGEQVRRVHVVGTILIVIGIASLLSGD